jgi:hypothetical protein
MPESIETPDIPRSERHGFAVGDRVFVHDQESQFWAGYGHITHIGGCFGGAFEEWCRDNCRVYEVDITGGIGGNLGGSQLFMAPQLAHAD